MAISGISVGSNTQPVVSLGDPNTASQVQSVISVSDATSVAGIYGSLDLAVQGLVNVTGSIDRARAAVGTVGIQAISIEGTKNTYSCASPSITLATAATDFFQIVGSSTKTVRVLKVTISGIATSAASPDILLIKRSSANSGGTSTQPTIVPNDSNNSAPTAVVNLYSVNPTTGTAVGTIRARKLNLGAAGAAGTIEWDFSNCNDQAIVLRGVSQSLCLNFNGQSVPSGASIDIEVEFVEDNS